ncbi:hypothetical protein LINPERPRIM_LOCUS23490 [Linum perenne]
MANKIWVEATLISARGLKRSSSSLWKRHWFAVGWIDPNAKYCTTVSKDGSPTPTWRTKFATLVDDSNFQDSALTVEVYSREPIFLRETLEGTATILLKEFVLKYYSSKKASDEVGSYQLRKRNSNRTQGLVDVSVRVTEESGESGSYPGPGGDEGIVLKDHNNNPGNHMLPPLAPYQQHQNPSPSFGGFTPQMPYPAYHHPVARPASEPAAAPRYHGSYPTMPHHPPPPGNVGYMPSFLPNSEYLNMPASATSSAAPGRSTRPTAGNFAVGAGIGGALAAGAMIYGEDVMSAFSIPSQSLQGPSFDAVSLDPPFGF